MMTYYTESIVYNAFLNSFAGFLFHFLEKFTTFHPTLKNTFFFTILPMFTVKYCVNVFVTVFSILFINVLFLMYPISPYNLKFPHFFFRHELAFSHFQLGYSSFQ